MTNGHDYTTEDVLTWVRRTPDCVCLYDGNAYVEGAAQVETRLRSRTPLPLLESTVTVFPEGEDGPMHLFRLGTSGWGYWFVA